MRIKRSKTQTTAGGFDEAREAGFLSERDEHRVGLGASYEMKVRPDGDRWEERAGADPLRVLRAGGCESVRFPQIETRTAPLEIRADEADGSPVIRGTAAVFGETSVDLGGFLEIIMPGFFRDVLAGDTVFNWQHDDGFVLARTTAIPPTLRLAETSEGLEIDASPADHQTNRDRVFSPIGRGEVRHMSFAFTTKNKDRDGMDGDAWEELESGMFLRTLKPGGCRELFDVTAATRPAYLGTDVGLRSLNAWLKEHPSLERGRERMRRAMSPGAADLRLRAMRQRAQLLQRGIGS